MGILTTAEKQGLLQAGHHGLARETMLKSNAIGTELARVPGVHAMTDVTGFGLAGHLAEVCAASGVKARIDYKRLPRLAEAEAYRRQGAVPGGSARNRQALGAKLPTMDEAHWQWLCDPQPPVACCWRFIHPGPMMSSASGVTTIFIFNPLVSVSRLKARR